MVNHDHNRIKSRGETEVGDKIDGELFEGERDGGQDWAERRNGRMDINFVLLTDCATSDKMLDEGGQTRPPEVTFKDGLGAENSHVP